MSDDLVVSVEDVKTFFNMVGFKYDEKLLPSYLEAAQRAVEQRVGPLSVGTVTERVRVTTAGAMLASTAPVIAVTGAVDAADTAYALPRWTPAGRLTWTQGGGPAAEAVCIVTYTTGRETCPENLRQAVIEMTRWLMRGYNTARPGGQSTGTSQAPMRSDLPASVASLLYGEIVTGFA